MAIFTVREEDAIYLAAYLAKTIGDKGPDDDTRYRAWQSVACAECGRIPNINDDAPHVLDADGYVLIGCEGYHQVNPNVLGLEKPNWSDWHEEIGGLADGAEGGE